MTVFGLTCLCMDVCERAFCACVHIYAYLCVIMRIYVFARVQGIYSYVNVSPFVDTVVTVHSQTNVVTPTSFLLGACALAHEV